MINSVGLSGTSLGGIGAGTQRADGLTRLNGTNATPDDKRSVATTISQLASGGAPVDTDRVSAIRAAIKAGSYRANPDAIASKMIESDIGGAFL